MIRIIRNFNALIKRRSTIITIELLRTRNNILIPQIYGTHLEEFNRSSIHTFSLRLLRSDPKHPSTVNNTEQPRELSRNR